MGQARLRAMGETRWLRVPVSEIDYVRSIFEAYDGLGMLTAPAPDSP